jgi:hypothetical protein
MTRERTPFKMGRKNYEITIVNGDVGTIWAVIPGYYRHHFRSLKRDGKIYGQVLRAFNATRETR